MGGSVSPWYWICLISKIMFRNVRKFTLALWHTHYLCNALNGQMMVMGYFVDVIRGKFTHIPHHLFVVLNSLLRLSVSKYINRLPWEQAARATFIDIAPTKKQPTDILLLVWDANIKSDPATSKIAFPLDHILGDGSFFGCCLLQYLQRRLISTPGSSKEVTPGPPHTSSGMGKGEWGKREGETGRGAFLQ